VLSGGSALLPNLPNYLGKILDTKVIIGDPWARVSYPVDLKPLLHEIGPRMSVAIGLAMREME
jgi:Tfp pilus assembly PilM family ATPase